MMRTRRTSSTLLCAAAAIAVLVTTNALGQGAASYPNKPVRIILPYATGGGTNTITRLFADAMTKDLGQSFVVDNRPGGSTIIGTAAAAKAAPDGYTLMVITATLLVNHWTQPNLPYDTLKDLVGVSTLIRNPHMLVMNASLPANNLKELVAYAQKNPGKINMGVNGLGSFDHLETLLFAKATGTKYTVVGYKGGDTGLPDLLSGQVPLSFNNPGTIATHIKAGKLKGVAVGGERRNPLLPDVPTFAEAGMKDFDASNQYTMFAPAATPRDILEKLNGSVARVQANKDMQEQLSKRGSDVFVSSVTATNAFIRASLDDFGKVVKEHDVKAGD